MFKARELDKDIVIDRKMFDENDEFVDVQDENVQQTEVSQGLEGLGAFENFHPFSYD